MKVTMLLAIAFFGSNPNMVSGTDYALWDYYNYYGSQTLQMHNNARATTLSKYGYYAAPMTWDSSLAYDAQQWAVQIIEKRDCTAMEFEDHSGHRTQGENMAYNAKYSPYSDDFSQYPDLLSTIKGWWGEESHYKYALTQDKYANTNYNQWIGYTYSTILHYTQIIWADSTKIGCGAASCRSDGWNRIYIVCRYSKKGNYGNEYPNGTSSASTTPFTNLPLLTMVSAALIVNIIVLAVIVCYRRRMNASHKALESNELEF